MQSAITAEVVEPYAEALMSLTKSEDITDEVAYSVRELKNLFEDSDDLRIFFR